MRAKLGVLSGVLALVLAGVPTGPAFADPVSIPDPALRGCIAKALGVEGDGPFGPAELASITRLSCSPKTAPFVHDLTGIAQLTGLEYLQLVGQQLDDLAPLDGVSSLKFLVLEASTITRVPDALALAGLEGVDLRRVAVPDLGFLDDQPKLATLDVRGFRGDLSPLAGLPALTRLVIGENGDTDLGALTALERLTSLSIHEPVATSLPELGMPPNLRSLHIQAPRLADLAAISGWTALPYLSLATPVLADLSPVAGLDQLTGFEAFAGVLSDLRPLRQASRLRTLRLSGNRVADLSPIAGLTRLEVLSLSGNVVADLAALKNLANLREVELSGNRIADLEPLAALTGLRRLELADNRIVDLGPLARLTDLQELDLHANEIVELAALAPLTGLATLDLSDNKIREIGALAPLTGLATLGLSGNQILDFGPLAGHAGKLSALDQKVVLPQATYRVPFAVRIAGPDGRIPTEMYFSEGTSYSGGKLSHTYAGPNGVSFTVRDDSGKPIVEASAEQRVGPDQRFSQRPTVWIHSVPTVGMDVGAVVGRWSPTPSTTSLQWYREKTAIPGATSGDYRVTARDLGHRLRVRLVVRRDGYVTETQYSSYTRKVIRGTFYNVDRPRITGSPKTGRTLSVNAGNWSPTPTKLVYQWYRGSKKIPRATKKSYTLTAADLGKKIKVRVTGSASGVETGYEFSKATAKVGRGDVRSVIPLIKGNPAVGAVLKADAGGWGPSKVSLKYQWRRDGKPIKGATKGSYRVSRADAGHSVSVVVRGSRTGYRTVSRASAAVAVPRTR